MGTQLNIKSEAAYRLASRLPELTGESLTSVVTRALQAELDRQERTPEHAEYAREARRICGRKRHPAQLNFSDCMVYGVAKAESEPLLLKGGDFSRTDIEPALKD